MKNRVYIFALLFLIFTMGLQAQNFKVIVNQSNSITSINRTELTNIFLKKISKFSNGTTAIPVDQVESSSVRGEFSTSVLKRNVAAVKSFWNQQLFSGAGVPPEEKKTDADVISFIKANPGAIGYVAASSAGGDVKVISVE
jgi:ABC-type phosphate transport system substrate-binding protein